MSKLIQLPFVKVFWKHKVSFLFLFPSLLLLSVFVVLPLIKSFQYSLYSWDGITAPIFIGLENFKTVLQDPDFGMALKNNIIFTLITTVGTVGIGFLLAVAIERRVRGWAIFKFTYFIPVMISMTVVGVLFNRIFEPSFGVLNRLLGLLGLDSLKMAWLGDPNIALYSIIAVTIWQYSGFTMLLLLAAMEGIDPEIHDAATIDGVSTFQRIFSIILPSIKRVILIVSMLQVIFSFKVFDIVWVMTYGGPGNASEILGTYLYKTAFRSYQFGYASAIAIAMTLIIFGISIIYIYFSRLSNSEKE